VCDNSAALWRPCSVIRQLADSLALCPPWE
jgi:hypothetical protein